MFLIVTLVNRYVKFFVETFVRVSQNQSTGRKRRSADDESLHQSPDIDDILAEIDAIEKEATTFILGGEMKMPANMTLGPMSPYQTVEFVQIADDGSIAADCSSGSCECSDGFIDNGNGCEPMTVEQAATTQSAITQAATSHAPATTEIPLLEDPKLSLWVVIEQVDRIFEDTQPENPNVKLLEKWRKIGEKFQTRFLMLLNDKKCNFDESFPTDNMVWDGPPCWVKL